MSRDLDEFLRRAAERRAEKQNQRRAPVTNPHTAPASRPSPITSASRNTSQSTSRPPAKSASPAPSWLDSNRPAVSTIAPPRSIEDQVDFADERMSQHLRDSFDHQMGGISEPTRSTTAEITPASAQPGQVRPASWIEELLTMLTKPSSVGTAVLLREILDRPEHRW